MRKSHEPALDSFSIDCTVDAAADDQRVDLGDLRILSVEAKSVSRRGRNLGGQSGGGPALHGGADGIAIS